MSGIVKYGLFFIVSSLCLLACSKSKINGCWSRQVCDDELFVDGKEVLMFGSGNEFSIVTDMRMCRPDSVCSLSFTFSLKGIYNHDGDDIILKPDGASFVFAVDSTSFRSAISSIENRNLLYHELSERLEDYFREIYLAPADGGISLSNVHISHDIMTASQPPVKWVRNR